jgi:hypothetical protein
MLDEEDRSDALAGSLARTGESAILRDSFMFVCATSSSGQAEGKLM